MCSYKTSLNNMFPHVHGFVHHYFYVNEFILMLVHGIFLNFACTLSVGGSTTLHFQAKPGMLIDTSKNGAILVRSIKSASDHLNR